VEGEKLCRPWWQCVRGDSDCVVKSHNVNQGNHSLFPVVNGFTNFLC
jgi:hypothetical protein